jgi:hypothetical protein
MKKTILNEQVSRIKQMMGIVEQIDSDDEELELAQLYNDEDEEAPLDGFTSEFSDPDEYSDLHDLSIEKRRLSQYKPADMKTSPTRDMDYKGAIHHSNIAGAGKDFNSWDDYHAHMRYLDSIGKDFKPSSEFLDKYGTPDPDAKTLADLKDTRINWPKIVKTKYDHEDKLSWDEKKKLMAQREEKRIAMELKKMKREELRNLQLNAWNEKNSNRT